MPHSPLDVAALVIPLPPIPPSLPMNDVADLFLQKEYAGVLSLPIVADGQPVGMMSRYRFMDVYLNKRFGPALFARYPVERFMNTAPMLVDVQQPLSAAAQQVSACMQSPLTEDFIITQQGKYVGVGVVVDLLKAMERELRSNTRELNDAYAQLKSSQLALVQSEKMASLGQMVAGIAHEINTPLGYVKNNVSMEHELLPQAQAIMADYERVFDGLLDGSLSEEQLLDSLQTLVSQRSDNPVQEMLGAIHDLAGDSLYGLGQITELVNDLKNFSRMDAAPTDTVNLNDCIDSALNIARNVLKHKLAIVREFGDLPAISCAPSQLNQVFLNLFTNAAQAIDGVGQLTIRTWPSEAGVHVTVSDNGKGIPEEVVHRIFDPFFTTKPMGEGTGLGLAISYQIIQQHQGDIHVTSRLGEGTTFHIRLPIHPIESRS